MKRDFATSRTQLSWWPFSRTRLRQPSLGDQQMETYANTVDAAFDEERAISSTSSAQPFNLADQTAHLNFNDVEPTPSTSANNLKYEDVAGQDAMKSVDVRSPDHSLSKWILTVVRGRAMPLKPLLASVIWCVTAVVISYFTRRDYPPHRNGECRQWCTPLAVDGDALSYVGFALFLLTSFRVQESYGRYMEAARVWTTIGGTITSFSKYIMQTFPAEGMIHKGDRERILSFLVAFPVALKRQLRNERDLRELKSILTSKDLAGLQHADSMPSFCLAVLSGYLLEAKKLEDKFPQTFIVHLIKWIADLAGAADVCDQIKTMPAPYSYITHLSTFLGLWLFFLPFAIVEFMGWGTILIVSFISYGILGVVSNAKELEDPFGSDFNDLPLGRMALQIQKDVSVIYETCKDGSVSFVSNVDMDDVLLTEHKYWLNSNHVGMKGEKGTAVQAR